MLVADAARALFETSATPSPGHTLELIHSDERLGPIVARLAAGRGVEEEVELRTRERTVERDETLARLAEFTGSTAGA